jgi:hypothetical protein
MGVALAIIASVVSVAAVFLVRVARRGMAASLVGEISEILNVVEKYEVENALARSALAVAPPLSPFSPIIYQSHAAKIGLLGSHRARLIGSFYASVQSLSNDLQALAADHSESGQRVRMKYVLILPAFSVSLS